MCPECGSENVRVVEYDFGRCRETGYHDDGERYECHDCGAYGDADELVIVEDQRTSSQTQECTNVSSDSIFGVVHAQMYSVQGNPRG